MSAAIVYPVAAIGFWGGVIFNDALLMMGRYAAVLGPTMVGITALAMGDSRLGMLSGGVKGGSTDL